MARLRSPKPPAFRAGDEHEGEVCRAPHPVYGWGNFVVEGDGPNFDKPLHWVDEGETKEDGAGKWVYAKDVE